MGRFGQRPLTLRSQARFGNNEDVPVSCPTCQTRNQDRGIILAAASKTSFQAADNSVNSGKLRRVLPRLQCRPQARQLAVVNQIVVAGVIRSRRKAAHRST